MKLIVYKERGHNNNFDAIQRMCKAANVEFEFTHSEERLKEDNYDILYFFLETCINKLKFIM